MRRHFRPPLPRMPTMPALRLTIHPHDRQPTQRRYERRTPAPVRSALVTGHAVIPPCAALASSTPEPGDSMSQRQFEDFMAAQIAAIEASGLCPEVWIERHSATF